MFSQYHHPPTSSICQACAKSSMVLHSYGMLLPCGIDKFHGTEYVCCPSSRTGESAPPSMPSQEDDEEEEVEDEEIDETDLIEEENRWAVVKSVAVKYCEHNMSSPAKGRYYSPSGWISVVTLTYGSCSALINHSFSWRPPLNSITPPSETPTDEQPTQKEEPVDQDEDEEEEDEEEYHYVYEDEEADKEDEDEKKESSKMSESQEDKTLQEVKGL